MSRLKAIIVVILYITPLANAIHGDDSVTEEIPYAVPTTDATGQQPIARMISDQITNIIHNITKHIRDAKMDPYDLDRFEIAYGLPVPIIFDTVFGMSELLITGMSNIVVNNMMFGIISSRLTVDISLPKIEISLSELWWHITVIGRNFSCSTDNLRLAIVETRIAGQIGVNVGIISGITLRDVELEFTLGGVEYEGNVYMQGWDLTKHVREFVMVSIPDQIAIVRKDISHLINLIVMEIGNGMLNP